MIGAYIGVLSENFNMYVPLERRITFLRGDSGVGKTSFVDYIRFILENGETFNAKLEKPKDFGVMIGIGESIKLLVKELKNHIIIIDDTVYSEGIGFTNALMKHVISNNLFILIINRVDLKFDESIESSFDYSAKSILWVEKIPGSYNHEVVPLLYKCNTSSTDAVKYIISEDTNGMSEFCSKFNKSNVIVDNQKGKNKDNIINFLQKVPKKSDILLFVDLASFGKNLWDLYFYASSISMNIILDCDYECFEYMILSSNLFKDIWEIDNSVNNFFSWEKYFEKVLEGLSQRVLKHGYHHKKKCPICMIKDCNICKSYDFCDKVIKGDKLKVFLKGTNFEYISDILSGG